MFHYMIVNRKNESKIVPVIKYRAMKMYGGMDITSTHDLEAAACPGRKCFTSKITVVTLCSVSFYINKTGNVRITQLLRRVLTIVDVEQQ
jgi:phage terminase large subunit-like protein